MTADFWLPSFAYIRGQNWFERGVEFPADDVSPGYVLEEWMGLDGVRVRWAAS